MKLEEDELKEYNPSVSRYPVIPFLVILNFFPSREGSELRIHCLNEGGDDLTLFF